MQLIKLTNSLRPLTIAAGLLSVASTVAYTDIDSYSGILTQITNNKTSEYIKSVDKSDNVSLLHKFRFQNHFTNWEKKTFLLSSTKAIVDDMDFHAIVKMGKSAVPYIIDEIEQKPSTLVWALNFIYNRKITNNPNATITDACKLWVRELKK